MRKKTRTGKIFVLLAVLWVGLPKPAFAVPIHPLAAHDLRVKSPDPFQAIGKGKWAPIPADFLPEEALEAVPLGIALQTLILEAVGEGYEGMVAVSEVIRNRTELFQKDVSEVCLAPYQFSGWNDRERAEGFLRGNREHYPTALKAWRASASTDWTAKATDYHTDAVSPWWASSYRRTVKLGAHLFYSRK